MGRIIINEKARTFSYSSPEITFPIDSDEDLLVDKLELDSSEEKYFFWYLTELVRKGYIKYFTLQSESFVLSEPIFFDCGKEMKTKIKQESRSLIGKHVYTPDVRIVWDTTAEGCFCYDRESYGLYSYLIKGTNKHRNPPFIAQRLRVENTMELISYIDVKGSHDRNNMERVLHLNQCWMLQVFNLFVQKVKIPNFFKSTFTPTRFLFTDKTKVSRKLHYTPRGLSAFVKENE
jgi:hypothetical protein